jgi:hypothetical protein
MNGITIFSAPKPFSDPHINIIQRNAIRSWMDIGPQAEVLLIGDETGLRETAQEFNLILLPDVKRNEFGTPLVDSIFELARQTAKYDVLIYLNADIILFPETRELVESIHNKIAEFLLVGRRWDLDIDREIDFSRDWVTELKEKVRLSGKLRAPTAIDYFIFPSHLFQGIPPFAIGRAGWDNWMIYYGNKQPWPLIEITPSLQVIHQNHDYSHLPNGKVHYDLEESHRNVELAGGMKDLYDLLDVPLVYKDGQIRRKRLTVESFIRKLERLVIPEEQVGWRWSLTRIFRKTRRRITGHRVKA